jgi:hypothetical protein
MNIEVINPYSEGTAMWHAFNKGVETAYNKLRIKKFTEELPEENQEIVVFHSVFETKSEPCIFLASKYSEGYYTFCGDPFDCWLPYTRFKV